jgi:hypothetical protein
VLSLYFAVALNCCVAPIPILTLEGVSETDVRLFGGGWPVTFDGDPHPVLAIMTKSESEKAAIETKEQKHLARMDSFDPTLQGRKVSLHWLLKGCFWSAGDQDARWHRSAAK